jgi:hypothetical protein
MCKFFSQGTAGSETRNLAHSRKSPPSSSGLPWDSGQVHLGTPSWATSAWIALASCPDAIQHQRSSPAAFPLPQGCFSRRTVQAGHSVSAPINVTGGAAFSGSVTFACSGLPTNASCGFSPATITVAGTPAIATLLPVNTTASPTGSQLRAAAGWASAPPPVDLGGPVSCCSGRRGANDRAFGPRSAACSSSPR